MATPEEADKYTLIEALVQDAINDKGLITVYLVNGIKLCARPEAQDSEGLLLKNEGAATPFGVYKKSIATVLPEGSDKNGSSRNAR